MGAYVTFTRLKATVPGYTTHRLCLPRRLWQGQQGPSLLLLEGHRVRFAAHNRHQPLELAEQAIAVGPRAVLRVPVEHLDAPLPAQCANALLAFALQ